MKEFKATLIEEALKSYTEEELIRLYLISWNDYLTLDKFASDHQINKDIALAIIRKGRDLRDDMIARTGSCDITID